MTFMKWNFEQKLSSVGRTLSRELEHVNIQVLFRVINRSSIAASSYKNDERSHKPAPVLS